MPHHRTFKRSVHLGPPRALGRIGPPGIESQSGNDQKDVVFPGINADPLPCPRRSIAAERFRSHRGLQPPCRLQQIGHGTRAIVGRIQAAAMPSTAPIRKPVNFIPGGNHRMHSRRGRRRRDSQAVPAGDGGFSRNVTVPIIRLIFGAARKQNTGQKCQNKRGAKGHFLTNAPWKHRCQSGNCFSSRASPRKSSRDSLAFSEKCV